MEDIEYLDQVKQIKLKCDSEIHKLIKIKEEYISTNISQKDIAIKYNRSYRHMQRILKGLK